MDDGGRNTGDTINAHFVDLYLGMFFFAARCCEFCQTREEGVTKRITLGDLTFRDSRKKVIQMESEDDIPKARFVTVRFRDQKNREKDEKRTQGRTGRRELDPVIRLAWAVLRIKRRVRDWSDETDLCTVGEKSNALRITSNYSLEILREVCKLQGGKEVFGFDPEDIGNKGAGRPKKLKCGVWRDWRVERW